MLSFDGYFQVCITCGVGGGWRGGGHFFGPFLTHNSAKISHFFAKIVHWMHIEVVLISLEIPLELDRIWATWDHMFGSRWTPNGAEIMSKFRFSSYLHKKAFTGFTGNLLFQLTATNHSRSTLTPHMDFYSTSLLFRPPPPIPTPPSRPTLPCCVARDQPGNVIRVA